MMPGRLCTQHCSWLQPGCMVNAASGRIAALTALTCESSLLAPPLQQAVATAPCADALEHPNGSQAPSTQYHTSGPSCCLLQTKLEEMGVHFDPKPAGERTGMQVLPIGPTAHQVCIKHTLTRSLRQLRLGVVPCCPHAMSWGGQDAALWHTVPVHLFPQLTHRGSRAVQ